MSHRVAAVVATLIVTAATGGAGIAFAAGFGSSAGLTATVIRLNATTTKVIQLDSTHVVSSGTLTRRDPAGKGGAVTYSCTTVSSTVANCQSSYTLKRGIILGHVTVNFASGKISGTVTGGSGGYHRASGSVSGKITTGGVERLRLSLTS